MLPSSGSASLFPPSGPKWPFSLLSFQVGLMNVVRPYGTPRLHAACVTIGLLSTKCEDFQPLLHRKGDKRPNSPNPPEISLHLHYHYFSGSALNWFKSWTFVLSCSTHLWGTTEVYSWVLFFSSPSIYMVPQGSITNIIFPLIVLLFRFTTFFYLFLSH